MNTLFYPKLLEYLANSLARCEFIVSIVSTSRGTIQSFPNRSAATPGNAQRSDQGPRLPSSPFPVFPSSSLPASAGSPFAGRKANGNHAKPHWRSIYRLTKLPKSTTPAGDNIQASRSPRVTRARVSRCGTNGRTLQSAIRNPPLPLVILSILKILGVSGAILLFRVSILGAHLWQSSAPGRTSASKYTLILAFAIDTPSSGGRTATLPAALPLPLANYFGG
jgi:hypothetical protein